VDGKPAGTWYQAYGNSVSKWADDDFTVPAAEIRRHRHACVDPGQPAVDRVDLYGVLDTAADPRVLASRSTRPSSG
jgi:hypothetical protein